MQSSTRYTLIIITIFSIAMAFIEAAVVIYLRALYYPQGFQFPLRSFFEPTMLNIEWVREIATLVMLLSVAFLAGRRRRLTFAYFLYSFAIWDIFYYVFLKITLNWPTSLLTWDILFLIPIPWIAPVLAPLLVSLSMLILAFCIIYKDERRIAIRIRARELTLLSIGSALILYSFLYDYAKLLIAEGFMRDLSNLANNAAFTDAIATYIPNSFQWLPFAIGELLLFIAFILFCMKK